MTKKERQAQARAALSQKEKQEQEKARKSRRNAIIYTVVGIVVAIAVAALLVWDSGVIQTHMTALSVGNRKYTITPLIPPVRIPMVWTPAYRWISRRCLRATPGIRCSRTPPWSC